MCTYPQFYIDTLSKMLDQFEVSFNLPAKTSAKMPGMSYMTGLQIDQDRMYPGVMFKIHGVSLAAVSFWFPVQHPTKKLYAQKKREPEHRRPMVNKQNRRLPLWDCQTRRKRHKRGGSSKKDGRPWPAAASCWASALWGCRAPGGPRCECWSGGPDVWGCCLKLLHVCGFLREFLLKVLVFLCGCLKGGVP